MNGVFSRIKNLRKGNVKVGGFIKRWPTNPKVVFFGPPNVFLDELSQR
jgi:hypothetical protein